MIKRRRKAFGRTTIKNFIGFLIVIAVVLGLMFVTKPSKADFQKYQTWKVDNGTKISQLYGKILTSNLASYFVKYHDRIFFATVSTKQETYVGVFKLWFLVSNS